MKLLIYKERKKRQLTQMQLAKIISITRAGYCLIENGQRKPSWKVQQRLERFFGIPASELLAESEEEKV